MKIPLRIALFLLMAGLAVMYPVPSKAQPLPPNNAPADPQTADLVGRLVNYTQGTPLEEPLEVMLHIAGASGAGQNMLHAAAGLDGRFVVPDVPVQPGWTYTAMVNYQDSTYASAPVTADDVLAGQEVEIRVYESSPDLSKVEVTQMHVLFNFAGDGLEVKQLYLLSNYGLTTVKGEQALADGKKPTYSFPLPEDAGYLYFEPQGTDRFIKQAGGFSDTAPINPGAFSTQAMVSYVLPYKDPQVFTYTNPLPTRSLTLALPASTGVQIEGANIPEPEKKTSPDGSEFLVYLLPAVGANTPVQVELKGIPPGVEDPVPAASSQTTPTAQIPVPVLGLVVGLGILLMGIGIWTWAKQRRFASIPGEEDEMALEENIPAFPSGAGDEDPPELRREPNPPEEELQNRSEQ